MRFIKRTQVPVIITLLLLLISSLNCVFAQTPNTNYVRVRMPQVPVTDTLLMDTIPVQRQAVFIQYSDALGRGSQSLQVKGSANQMDLIQPYVYDNMGRSVTSYLPYPDESTNASTTGTLRANATVNAVSFYNPASPGSSKIPTDVAPYSQIVYEASPLGRMLQKGKVGSIFQPGTGHIIKASYQVNGNADNINYYVILQGIPTAISSYGPQTMTKTIVTDENGHRQALWEDMQARIVTRSQLDAPSTYFSTDYIYNDLDQLINIVPPAAKKQFANPTGPPIAQTIAQQCYNFHYDSIGRLVEKKVPDKGWVYTVYNHGDQPVLSQDSNMRAKNQWLFVKYDAEGRIIQTGVYTNTIVTGRKAMQYFCDTNFPILWETWQPGIGYTDNAFPQQSAIPGTSPLAIYTIYYYDDYSFTEAASKPFQTNIYNNMPTGRTMGMLTGTSVYVLGTANQRMVTVNYFDNQDRLIQEISDNHLGQVDVVNNQYNYISELTGSQRITTTIAGSPITMKDRYVYDHLSRLMDTYESLNGSAEIDISHNVYNEIGQKVSEGLHYAGTAIPNVQPGFYSATITENTTLTSTKTDTASQSVTLSPGFSITASATKTYVATIGATFAQTQEFRYTIRDELSSINNGTLNYDHGVTQSDPNALFGESITYSESSPLGATPQYNGSISGITWRNKIEQTGLPGLTTGGQGYSFIYDNVNRLTQSNYFTQTGGSFTQNTTGALTEKINGYDEMGNIDTLQRRDKNGNLLNNLTYTYQSPGNQLASISDAGSQNISGTYTYDGNGNMTGDSRKGIAITYNYLDLPDTVKQGTSKLVFTYDATGKKLYKQLIVGGTITSQRHYVEDVELTASSSISYDGKVESIAMDEGRIVNAGSGGYKYEYYLQDHLYTNRVAFQPNTDGTLNLTTVQNYYSFGEDMGDATMNYSASPQNLYKYEGKEIQPELNLNTYDFGSRHYDPVLGRWTSIDPLAEESDDLSPYNYVENNPMNLMDPDGMQPGCYEWGGAGLGTVGNWSGWGLNALSSGYSAAKALAWHNPVTTNLTADLKKVQRNQPLKASPQNQSGNESGGFRWPKWSYNIPIAGAAFESGNNLADGHYTKALANFGTSLAELFTWGSTSEVSVETRVATRTVTETEEVAVNNFTKDNFRKNLIKLTGEPGVGEQAHHVFPQQFREAFEKAKINIDDPKYGSWWQEGSHQSDAKLYNKLWEKFLGGSPSKAQILQEGKAIMAQFGRAATINY